MDTKNRNSNQHNEKDLLEIALKEIGKTRRKWLWIILLLASSPGLLNGMHIGSYVFLTGDDMHHCYIREFKNSFNRWSEKQIENISIMATNDFESYGCNRLDLNYSRLSKLSYDVALNHVRNSNREKQIPCTEYVFKQNWTIISEWNLVCDLFYQRTHIQASYVVGKFIGSFVFGVIADEFGRKQSFILAALCYIMSLLLAPILDSFYIFLVQRFVIGFASCGCYVTAFTLVSEIIVGKARTRMCSLFNIPYPIGMIILTFFAYNVQNWKSLQLSMSLMTLWLPILCWFLPESPLWLFSKGKKDKAWNLLRSFSKTVEIPTDINRASTKSQVVNTRSMSKRAEHVFTTSCLMFSTSELARRSLVCYFVWFLLSANYYGLTLNGDNFNIDRYVYIFAQSVLEIFSYIVPIPLYEFFDRKPSCIIPLILSGVSLIIITLIPKHFTTGIFIAAMIGRFCSVSAFVIFELYTAELFPTSIRNTAIGICLTLSHVGSIVASYAVDILGYYKWYIPSTLFGILSILGVFAILILPETKNEPVYNSVQELNNALEKKLTSQTNSKILESDL